MEHAQLVGYWFFGALLSFGIVSAIRRWALAHKFLSIPSARGNHTQPTPLGGGIGVAGASLGLFGLLLVLRVVQGSLLDVAYLVAGATLALVGLRDDWHALSATLRLSMQAACALLLVLAGGGLWQVALPGLGVIYLGPLLGAVLAILWLVWMTNAFNFIDGIDAMSGLQALLIGAAWAGLLLAEGQLKLALLSGLLAAASLGFLCLNVTPALIFMGDTGSTFLGFSFAALPLLATAATGNPRLAIVGLFFVAPVLFDPGVTLLFRLRKHVNLFEAHRDHFYQRLARLEHSHLRIAGLYGTLTLSGVIGGLVFFYQGTALGLLAVFAVIGLLVGMAFGVTQLERWHAKGRLPALPPRSAPARMEAKPGGDK